jgi:hypothetical protein
MCMSKMCWLVLSGMLVSTVVVGCSKNSSTSSKDAGDKQVTGTSKEVNAEIIAALAQLSAEDRVVAESQRFCAVEQHNLLGSMGTPFKLMIEGQPVFLCCEGCKDAALKDPQATLAAVTTLKQANSSGK